MNMTIAIASKRGPKVDAVRNVIPRLQGDLGYASASLEYLTYDIEGGTNMPRTLEELMTGAEQRVLMVQERIRKLKLKANYFIGMEGGFHRIGKHTYLQSWAYVSDEAEGYFGSSGNVVIPDNISYEVMERKRELGVVIDEVTLKNDVRSKEGTWGVLTKENLTRKQSFEIALISAFAPFYNKIIYKRN